MYQIKNLLPDTTLILLWRQHYQFMWLSVPQVRDAYLHFMFSIAKITREDRNLTQDDEHVWEEMMQVLELETDIANVSVTATTGNGILGPEENE